MKKRILVTGSSGFIGRHAVAEFAKCGYEVWAPLAREVDLLDFNQTREMVRRFRPTYLAHFAWYGEQEKVWDSPDNWRWSASSLALFDEFVENGGKHAFFAGSCAEYDWHGEILREDTTPLNPGSVYGISKNALREQIREMASGRSVSVAWGRIFFVYGPVEKEARLAPSILLPLMRNERAVVRCGNHVRDFLHVEDVAGAAAHLLDSAFDGAVNIASGQGIKLGEFAAKLARLAGREDLLEIQYAQPTPENPSVLVADVGLLRSTGFTPKFSLDEGLKTLVKL
jgi:nucleoside-diphosphate-sugar epimerase